MTQQTANRQQTNKHCYLQTKLTKGPIQGKWVVEVNFLKLLETLYPTTGHLKIEVLKNTISLISVIFLLIFLRSIYRIDYCAVTRYVTFDTITTFLGSEFLSSKQGQKLCREYDKCLLSPPSCILCSLHYCPLLSTGPILWIEIFSNWESIKDY